MIHRECVELFRRDQRDIGTLFHAHIVEVDSHISKEELQLFALEVKNLQEGVHDGTDNLVDAEEEIGGVKIELAENK